MKTMTVIFDKKAYDTFAKFQNKETIKVLFIKALRQVVNDYVSGIESSTIEPLSLREAKDISDKVSEGGEVCWEMVPAQLAKELNRNNLCRIENDSVPTKLAAVAKDLIDLKEYSRAIKLLTLLEEGF